MPKKDRKSPMDKRVDGSIYSFEKKEERKAALNLLKKCQDRCKKVVHLVKDSHTGEFIEHIQIVR